VLTEDIAAEVAHLLNVYSHASAQPTSTLDLTDQQLLLYLVQLRLVCGCKAISTGLTQSACLSSRSTAVWAPRKERLPVTDNTRPTSGTRITSSRTARR
jgi:hypothetical protein